MRFGCFTFTVCAEFPSAVFPSPLAAFSSTVCAYITSGDSVEIASSFEGASPIFFGRVLSVSTSPHCTRYESSIQIHPFIERNPTVDDVFILVQWFITNTSETTNTIEAWPHTPAATLRSCAGLSEAAPTNCLIWVSIRQIQDIVFMPHVNQCIQQLFGPLCGRSKTFYVRHRVVFEAESNTFQFVSLSIEDYGAFRFTSTSSFPFPSTYTERMFETLQKVTTANAKLLMKCGELASSVHTSFPMSLEGWRYISRRMHSFGECVSINVRKTQTKHCITLANLSLLSEVLPTTKHTIVADSADGDNAVQSVFASTMGLGVKK